MKNELKMLCDTFVSNRDKLEKIFKWENDKMTMASSLIYTGEGVPVNEMKLNECENIIKENTSVFSELRNSVKTILVTKMAISENPKAYFDKFKEVLSITKTSIFHSVEYRTISSLILMENNIENPAEVIEKSNEIFNLMKYNHPLITSDEDYPFATILAIHGNNIKIQDQEIEDCFNIAKSSINWFRRDGNAIQSLSHILALGTGKPKDKCDKVLRIVDILKENKHPYSLGFELTALGSLAIKSKTAEEIAQDIMDADDYLAQFKLFSGLYMSGEQRRMFAAILVGMIDTNNSLEAEGFALSSIVAIMIAQQIAMMVAMTASVNVAAISATC